MSEIRFYLDENVPTAIALGVRRRGATVTTVVESGLRMARDEAHMDYAKRHGLVLVSQDDDMLTLAAADPSHCGVVFAHQKHSIGTVINGLILVWSVTPAEDMIGRVEFI
jgi:hypothetical protein